MTIALPESEDRMVNVSIDTSVGGQPEKASQLVVNRHSGQIVSVKRFTDDSVGSKLRAWACFTHMGEEFGLPGESIAAFASFGAMVLVWTGPTMAVRRALAAVGRIRAKSSTPEAALGGSGVIQLRAVRIGAPRGEEH